MASKLRVYLAGPITGCNDEQKHWWREEIKTRLGKDFDLEDPADWADDIALTREIQKIEACDIVVANIWKESVGTTLGIVRARQQGKPVVLIDPNRINNPTLNALPHAEAPVHSVDEACASVKALAGRFKPVKVLKSNGAEQEFSPKNVTRSIAQACAAAGAQDAMFEERISGPVIAWARRVGGQQGYLTSAEIRDAIFRRLESMATDAALTVEMRSRARDVVEKWEYKEQCRDPEAAIAVAEQPAERAEQDAGEWKRLYKESARRTASDAEVVAAQALGPRFRTLKQVLDAAKRQWGAYLFIHDVALGEARKAKPKLDSKELEALYGLLEELGAPMHDRACAAADGVSVPTFEDRFGTERYAARESGETKDRYRKSAIVEYKGRKYFGLPHVKAKVDGNPLRIHFDEVGRMLLISYIGRHRPTFKYDG